MINVILWGILALGIYSGLKAFSAKTRGVAFVDGFKEQEEGAKGISEKEAVMLSCLIPLGTVFAIVGIIYMVFDLNKNPFEMITNGLVKIYNSVTGNDLPIESELED